MPSPVGTEQAGGAGWEERKKTKKKNKKNKKREKTSVEIRDCQRGRPTVGPFLFSPTWQSQRRPPAPVPSHRFPTTDRVRQPDAWLATTTTRFVLKVGGEGETYNFQYNVYTEGVCKEK